jgi:hypothetical protein
MNALRSALVCLSLLAFANGAEAATKVALATAATNDGPPDWTGVYDIVGDILDDIRGKHEDLFGFKPLHPGLVGPDALDAVVIAHLQPWAVAKMNATDSAADDPGSICQLAGIFRHPPTVAGFMWLSTPSKILMVSTDLNEVGVRRIYLTDKHPRNLAPTWDGHSIGHWEGSTLLVDTVGFNDKSWLNTSLEPHTEDLHVVERIRAVGDGSLLEVYTTVDDRKALTAPYSYSRYYKKTNTEFAELESDCNPEPGDQQMWNYMRHNALKQYDNRTPDQ